MAGLVPAISLSRAMSCHLNRDPRDKFTAGPAGPGCPAMTKPTPDGYSIGTMAASFELRSVSDVFTLRTLGAAVSFSTKA